MARVFAVALCLLAAASAVSATTYINENFNDAKWDERWVVGTEWKSADETGEWKWTAGETAVDESDKAIKTGEDARFYSISAKMDKEFDNKGKDLILALSVKHEQTLDCGGAYIKLLPPGFDQAEFGGDTDYAIMFGPDVCGSAVRRTHAILTYKGKNLLTTKNLRCETDHLSHLYTLILHPDNTYEVRIDDKKIEGGSITEHWDMLPAKKIKDPEQSKPADWVDEAKIPDPEDKKPEGYDDIPAMIPDPEAEKPDDWDDEDDGEWEPPMIDNPEYQGEWKPRMIDNPDYQGPWVHPMIDNPEYEDDDNAYNVCSPCSHVGFELWQVKSGTMFDDIIVTDSEQAYDAHVAAWKEKSEAEIAAKKAADEAAAAAAEAAAAAAEEEDDEDDEDEDEHDEL